MDAMKNKTIVLTGGGSGGHVIPILALLPEIKENFDKNIIKKIANATDKDIEEAKMTK